VTDVVATDNGRPDLGLGRRAGKKLAVGALQGFGRLGVHVLPRHFYSPVADRHWLRENAGAWQGPVQPTGVHWDLDAQWAWLAAICEGPLGEVTGFSFLAELEAMKIPFRYGLIEAQVLHCFVRSERPARIVEIGSGASTAIMAAAVARNQAEGLPSASIVSVDPYASGAVEALDGVDVVKVSALEASADLFQSLSAGDLLFIDSSHAVKTGSELARLYLEVIPALAPQVTVHIHDTYLPFLYSPWVLEDLWDWQETTLLLALLTHNDHLEVLCAESALHHDRAEQLKAVLPDYVPLEAPDGIVRNGAQGHFPSSTWLRTRRP
jgi:hypothetical protein